MTKRSRLIIDEANCEDADSDEGYRSEADSAGSLKQFIVDDDDDEDSNNNDEEIEDTSVDTEEETEHSNNLLLKASKKETAPPTRLKKGKQQQPKQTKQKPTSTKPPPSKKAKKNPIEPTKLPGDLSYPLNCFSLTITKTGGDIAIELLDILDAFVRHYCTKGT